MITRYVLQHTVPDGCRQCDLDGDGALPVTGWHRFFSLGGWEDPVKRAAVLADFRAGGGGDWPGTRWRMVKITEEVLDE